MQIVGEGSLNLGVEVVSGRPWVGVDQHVGHGSADALFALTTEQYEAELTAGWSLDGFRRECWSGERPERLMYFPRGATWLPESWTRARVRTLPPRFAGEIWHHVDALGSEDGSELRKISEALSGGVSTVQTAADGVRRITFPLTGDDAYPRPGALIAGLSAASTREDVARVLGHQSAGGTAYPLEGDLLELGYDDESLAQIVLIRPLPRPRPGGVAGILLAAVGEPEEGAAFRAVLQHAGSAGGRRWMSSSGRGRRAIDLDSGVEIQTENATVTGVRVPVSAGRMMDALFPGTPGSPTRADIEALLGPASDAAGGSELRTYDDRELLVSYGDDGTVSELIAVARGAALVRSFRRWRSGDCTRFLDALGLDESHPLVAEIRAPDGVRVETHRGRVTAISIGKEGYQTERFTSFIDGGAPELALSDRLFGSPEHLGERDALYDFAGAWIHTHADDGARVSWITVCSDLPRISGLS